MSTNLLKPEWAERDTAELRCILDAVVGGTGQYDSRDPKPGGFYLPLAGSTCRVKMVFSPEKEIVAVEPGPAFDATQWQEVVDEFEGGSAQVGREYSFSGRRVLGSWYGKRSGVQILPPPADAPTAPVEIAEHPFILEFPTLVSNRWPVTNFRRMREHRQLTLLLNVLLTASVTPPPHRARHFWAIDPGGAEHPRWVQEFYFAKLGAPIQSTPSPAAESAIEEVDPHRYYTEVGHDGRGLRVPTDLDDSIVSFMKLSRANRDKLWRAAFWMDAASRQWSIAASASFASLAIAIEALGDRNSRPTTRFRNFIEQHAPGKSLADRRAKMYNVRSDILHGSGLLEMDQAIPRGGWAPPERQERDLMEELWGLARIAMRSWLKNPT